MKLRNETKVGLLAVVSLTLLIIGYGLVSGNKLFSTTNDYYAIYKKVNGLQEANPVFLRGYRVGEIEAIKIIDPQDPSILVKFSVQEDIKVTKGSTAQIYSSDILGSKAIQLLINKKATTYHQSGDTLKGESTLSLTESLSNEISPLKTKTTSLITAVDTLIGSLNAIMAEGGKEQLQRSVRNFSASLENLASSSRRLDTMIRQEQGQLHKILKQTSELTKSLNASSEEITNTMKNISNVSDSLAAADIKKSLDEAKRTISSVNKIVKKVDKGQGSLGKLLNDENLYNNLESSTSNLDSLVKDIKANPQRYIHFSIMNLNNKNKD